MIITTINILKKQEQTKLFSVVFNELIDNIFLKGNKKQQKSASFLFKLIKEI